MSGCDHDWRILLCYRTKLQDIIGLFYCTKRCGLYKHDDQW